MKTETTTPQLAAEHFCELAKALLASAVEQGRVFRWVSKAMPDGGCCLTLEVEGPLADTHFAIDASTTDFDREREEIRSRIRRGCRRTDGVIDVSNQTAIGLDQGIIEGKQ